MSDSAASMPAPRQTVFKRHRRSNFTVLGNAVLFDPRLELEECAAIVKLLAKPHDWQIHPSALRKEWGVGREKFYRIINKLIRLGYVTRGEMIKDAWNRFIACEYIVTDEPEAPPSEIEVEESSGFEPAEDDAAGEGGVAANDAETEIATGVASVPHAGFPDTAQPHTANQHGEKELRELQTKTPPLPPAASGQPPPGVQSAGDADDEPSQRSRLAAPPAAGGDPPPEPQHRGPAMVPRGPGGGSGVPPEQAESAPTFDQFVTDYRPEPHMSLAGAKRRWMRLTERQQIDALKFLVDFRADRTKKGWKMPDMRRYLLDQHWVPYAKKAVDKDTFVGVKRGTPQWYRWREFFEATEPRKLAFFDTRDSWTARSEWPPPLPPKEFRATPAPSVDQHHEENKHGTT